MAFSDNLKLIRELRNKQPMDVVRETGIAKAKYYSYEAGKYEPGPEIVDQLADYFNVRRGLFFEKKLSPNDLKGELQEKKAVPQVDMKHEYVPIHVLDHYRNTAEHIMQENKNLWEMVKELRLEARRS